MTFPISIEQKIIAFSQSTRPTDMAPYLVEQIKSRYVTVKTLLEYARTKQCEDTKIFFISADILCKLGDIFLKAKDDGLKKQSIAFYQLAADRWDIAENYQRAIWTI